MPGNDEEFPFFPVLRLNYISVFLLQLPLITNLRKIGEGFRLTMCEEFTNNYFEVDLILFRHVFFPSNPLLLQPLKAHVVKLADTSDLGSDAARYGGSSPSMGTSPKVIGQ